MQVTPQAKKAWEEVPSHVRMKNLAAVWCGTCRGSVNMDFERMSIKRGDLKLDGKCMTCGGPVCRIVERD